MMKRAIQFFTVLAFWGCEMEITPALPTVDPLMAVDAWLQHEADSQRIFIYTTNTYFDNSRPVGISDAEVTIFNTADPTEQYSFEETAESGIYRWVPPSPTDTFGVMGDSYLLEIVLDGTSYTALSAINRVPTIDSITWRFDEGDSFTEDAYFANFWARDFDGPDDTYWIKSWKNGEQLTLPSEINIAYDGAFSSGDNADGLIFIQPIRENINPFDFDEQDVLINPFEPGDSIFVEISSISNEAFFFLEQVQTQTNREGGFGELFAVPLANIQSNIFSEDPNEKVVGFFNISATQSLGKLFLEEDIRFD